LNTPSGSKTDHLHVPDALHIQAPDAMSALLLRHRLNVLKVDAHVMPAGETWEVRVSVTGEDVAATVHSLIEEEGMSQLSPLERA